MNLKGPAAVHKVPTTLSAAFCLFFIGCGSGIQDPTFGVIPTINAVSPSFVVMGASAQKVKISGTGFSSYSKLYFAGTQRSFTVVSSQEIDLALGASDLSIPGNFQIQAVNSSFNGNLSTTGEFSVWNLTQDASTNIIVPFPQFSPTTNAIAYSATGTISNYDVMATTSTSNPVTVLDIQIFSSSGASSIQDWFAQNIDDNNLLNSAGTFQLQNLPNGVTALAIKGSIPAAYLQMDGPVQQIYGMSPDGKYVIALSEGQEAQVSDFNYVSSILLPEILGSVRF